MSTWVYGSSWTEFGGNPGLARYRWNEENGTMEYTDMQDTETSFGSQAKNPVLRNVIYLANEVAKLPGMAGGGGRVFTCRIEADGSLTVLQKKILGCPNPAAMQVDHTGKYMLVACHSSNNAVTKIRKNLDGEYVFELEYDDACMQLYRLEADGTLGKLCDVVMHYGRGPLFRQQHAHPHSAEPAPAGEWYAVNDKGNDTIYSYRIDYVSEKLTEIARFKVDPGTMPRYIRFHPTLPVAYLNAEGTTQLRVLRWNARGHIETVCMADTLPEPESGEDRKGWEQQGMVLSRDGCFLYDVLHGPDQVAVFALDPETGIPTRIQNVKVSGTWARGAALSPDGKYLFVTCLSSDKIMEFSVGEDGMLTDTGREWTQSHPAYMSFCRTE